MRITASPRRLRPRPWWLLVAIVVAIAAGTWLVDRRGDPSAGTRAPGPAADPGGPAPSRDRAGRAGDGAAGTPQPHRARPAGVAGAAGTPQAGPDGVDPTSDLSDYVLPGEAPTMGEVIGALHARGIRTGLGAFPPPGTSPPVRGLAVPDDFPLPDGYVRHHQVTDDGQRIAPILMFAPDRDSIVVRGVRMPIPPDRIVTPELAPPGLPLRRVVIPSPREGGGRS